MIGRRQQRDTQKSENQGLGTGNCAQDSEFGGEVGAAGQADAVFASVDGLFFDDLADRDRAAHQRSADDQQHQQLAGLRRRLLVCLLEVESGVAGDGRR